MPKMTQNAVIFNKKINISCITVIAAVLLCAFCACIGGRGTGQESTTAPVLLTPSAEPTAEMTIKPSAAATNDPEKVRAMYSAIGGYIAELGFNLDFAPVADVNSNPNNTVIGNRAFGSDPKLVAKMVNAAISGLHKENIIACIKHFPGHGDTAGDTHDGYVALEKDWQQLSECELIPFYNAINETDMIMAAHITLTRGNTDNLPCSLSYDALTMHLRGEMGYKGVIITDALAMGAIVENYSSKESAVLAFNAGADILLMPYDYAAAFNGILSAVQTGEISLDRLNESVERILRLKAEFGMI